MKRFRLLSILLVSLLGACQAAPAPTPAPTQPERVFTPGPPGVMLELDGFVQKVHDPVIAKEDGVYYVFSTGGRLFVTCSKDMLHWEFCARVFDKNASWVHDVNPDLVDMWAPDISFYNGEWHLYYAVSNFGSQDSAIGLATNKTLDPARPDYEWVDQGIVLRSKPGDDWNAIDPNLVLDENGEPWLAWGSFWHGLYLRKLSAATGKFDDNAPEVYHLADRSTGPGSTTAIEASFILQHEGMWYLFASFDQCCQGVSSTYNVRVGRSESLTGPYIDKDGVDMTHGGGSMVLAAYDRWRGPGHNGFLVEDGITWMVYHAYDAKQVGISKLRIESVTWGADGWPSLPSQTK